MRLVLPRTVTIPLDLRWRWIIPQGDQLGILVIFLMGFQPFGSMPALIMFSTALALLVLVTPLQSKFVANWLAFSAYLAVVAACLGLFVSTRISLFIVYFLYWSSMLAGIHVLWIRMSAWNASEVRNLINWMLGLDLALNLVPVIMELAIYGIGDYITGLSGLLISTSLSQNRTNSVRAGCILVLAVANWRTQRNTLSLASAAFNMSALMLAVSVTTILSFVVALGAVVLFRRNIIKAVLGLAVLAALAMLVNFLNQANRSMDVFDFILTVNTRWFPKMDFYRQYWSEMRVEYPWLPFFGNGFGSAMNRFALLLNFQGTSSFPGKGALAALLEAPLIRRHLVDYYDLNNGVIGNSIISTPWSGLAALILELGAMGIALGTALALPFLKRVWKAGAGSLMGSGKFMLTFLLANLGWDCYLDYLEVIIPICICAIGLIGLDRARAEDTAIRG